MAADACIVSGMNGTHVDMAGAIAVADALGVERATAATLIAAYARGLAAGMAEKRQKEAEGEEASQSS